MRLRNGIRTSWLATPTTELLPILGRGTLALAYSDDAISFEATLASDDEMPSWVADAVKAVRGGQLRGVSPGFSVPPGAGSGEVDPGTWKSSRKYPRDFGFGGVRIFACGPPCLFGHKRGRKA